MMSESSNFDDFEGSTTYTGYGIRGERQSVINTFVGPVSRRLLGADYLTF